MSYPLPSIGIDFGTTTCCMAWVPPGSQVAEVIRNAEGRETTPTILYVGDDPEPLVGEPAAEMAAHENEGYKAIHSVKRDLLQARPFRVGSRRIQPVDAAAVILGKLQRDAEQGVFRGQPLTRTVITHPSRFDALQRDKLKEAANLAGFTDVILLPEPVAAALAYERWLAQTGSTVSPGDHILVYDFGGGTFDLAVLAREDDGTFREALVPEGLSHLGGNDLDTALASHVEERVIEEIGRNLGSDHDFGYPTIRAARDWKERLTASQRITASVDLPATSDSPSTRYSTPLTRDELEALIDERFIAPTIRLTLETFARAASLAGSPDRVGVVLIGGGTRVPLIEERLKEVLPVTPHAWDRRDLAVALGAAWHGHRVWANEPATLPPPAAQRAEHVAAPSPSAQAIEPTPPEPVTVPDEPATVETSHLKPAPTPEPTERAQDSASVTIVVDADGNGDYTSIAEAVAAAPPDATILIRKGTYWVQDGYQRRLGRQDKYGPGIAIDKPIRLIGDGEPGDAVINGYSDAIFTVSADHGLIRNLTITQLGSDRSGIDVGAGEITIEQCDIASATGCCVVIHHEARPVIQDCQIHHHDHHSRATGILVKDRGLGTLQNNDIFGNEHGVDVQSGSDPVVRGNRISRNTNGVSVQEHGKGTIEDNDILGNTLVGVSIGSGGDPHVLGNRIHENEICGIQVWKEGRGRIENNDVFANASLGMDVHCGNPIVRKNRINHHPGVGVAITDGSGVYEHNDLRNNGAGAWSIEDTPDDRITLLGNITDDDRRPADDPAPAAGDVAPSEPAREPIAPDTVSSAIVVDADGNGDYTSVAEAVAAAPSGATVLIRKGTYTGGIVLDKPLNLIGDGDPGDIILEAQDGNVITSTAPSGLVQNLHIRQTGGENGSCIEIASGELTIEDCDITSLSKSPDRAIDTGAGIDVHHNANPTVRRCRVHECRQHGVWVHDGGAGLFEDNDILANWIPGVGISAGGNPIFRGNRIHNGQGAGCYFFEQARGTLEDNDIFANSGTGISITAESNPVIRNNRIYDNGLAGINVLDQGRGMLEQNDIHENKGNGIEISSRANPLVQTNHINGNLGNGISVSNWGRGHIEDNEIHASSGSGIAVQLNSDPIVQMNRIHDCKEHGIAFLHQGTGGVAENNEITGNSLSGIYVSHGARPNIRQNRIKGNQQTGIHATESSGGVIEENTIGENTHGVKIENNSNPSVRLNTIIDNQFHGLVLTYSGASSITNNVIQRNLSGIFVNMESNPHVKNNKIQDNRRHGVEIGMGGSGYFVDNDMQRNAKGAWSIFFTRRMSVTRKGNRE